MKIVVMSDTHLDRITEGFETVCSHYCEGADLVIHLGDLSGIEVLNYLERYPLEAVSGNTDDSSIQNALPRKKIIRAGGFRLGIIHGWGSPVGLRRRLVDEFQGVDAVLFGHSHQALQMEAGGVFWFNPGSVTSGRGGLFPSLGILSIGKRIRGEIIPL